MTVSRPLASFLASSDGSHLPHASRHGQDPKSPTGWRNVWRTGKVALRGITGQMQFAGPSVVGEDETVQATIAHEPIGNVVAVTDEMRAAFSVYTTDGLFVDSVLASAGAGHKGQGYRKNFSFFNRSEVFDLPGGYFGGGQIHLDPATGEVRIATGKSTVESFTVRGWTSNGVVTEPIAFHSRTIDIGAKDIAVPMDIAQQLRGMPPASCHRQVPQTQRPPSLDGKLDSVWDQIPPTQFVVDGLNVDGPAHIDVRMSHNGKDKIYVRIAVNQSLTDWPVVPQALNPANRMFVHGRAATTCSVYLRSNVSAFAASPPQSNRAGGGKGVLGDARLVFGVFEDAQSKPALQVLGVYPLWNNEWGAASPATYAAGGTGAVTLDNVALLDLEQSGFTLSPDGFLLEMAAAIPIAKHLPMLPELSKPFLTNGDFSCNIKGFQKAWAWNVDLKASEIVWDEPTEAQIWANSWGNISFAG